MKVTIDVPVGTAILLKASQLNRKNKDGELTPLPDLIVDIIEKYYRDSPETQRIINQLLKERK